MKSSKRTAAVLFAAILATACSAPAETDLSNVDWRTVSAQVASNIAQKIAGAIAAKTNAVRALATPENYRLLKSTKLADAARKLSLQKQLAEAALQDEEKTEAGRLKWHGHYTTERIDMERLTATFVHEDGTEYTVDFKMPDILRKIAIANNKLSRPPMTNGVPRALAEARMRRHEERIRPTLTVTTEVNATHGARPEGGAR